LGPVEISYGLGGYQNECFSFIEQLAFQLNSFSGASGSKSLFIIPKFDFHANVQLLKVRNEQKSLGFTVGHGQTIVSVPPTESMILSEPRNLQTLRHGAWMMHHAFK
jgi:hypothetical protein